MNPVVSLGKKFICGAHGSGGPTRTGTCKDMNVSKVTVCGFHVKGCPLMTHCRTGLPLLKTVFSPRFKRSCCRVFSLKRGKGGILFASLRGGPSLQRVLALSFPVQGIAVHMKCVYSLRRTGIGRLGCRACSRSFVVNVIGGFCLLGKGGHVSVPSGIAPC